MKKRDRDFPHSVVLAPTIAAELRAWRAATGGVGVVFPSPAGPGSVTREAVEKVLKVTLGMRGKHSCHGWRASFATLARDAGFTRDVVAIVLDHEKDNAVRRAYDRGERLEDRKRLVAWWDMQLTGTGR
jgi:integrase